MTDYDKYVTAVNKIFECLNKMKIVWTSQDNLNYIEKIEAYKNKVISSSKEIEKISTDTPSDVEELG